MDVECGACLLKKLALLTKISVSNLNFASSQLYKPCTYMLYFLNEQHYVVLVYKKVSGVRLRQKTAKLFDVVCGAYLLKKLALLAKISVSNLNFASS